MTIRYVYRGGSWGISSGLCRSAYRYGDPTDFRLNRLGFRVLRSSKEEVKYRVIRGGSWFLISDYCRSAYRGRGTPVYRSRKLGFRVIKENKHDD